jgi:hypothetical protein
MFPIVCFLQGVLQQPGVGLNECESRCHWKWIRFCRMCIFIYKCYLYSRLSGGGERKRKCRYRLSLFVLFLFFGGGLRFEGCQWSNSCRSFVPIVFLFLGSIQKKHLDCDHVCTEILNWLFFHYNCNFDSDK